MTDFVVSRWIAAVLANDETSTDAELIDYFVENGVPRASAEQLVAKRNEHLRFFYRENDEPSNVE